MADGDYQSSGFFRRLTDLGRAPEGRRRGAGVWIRRRLVVGLLVIFPLVITVFFARFIFELLDRWFRPISRQIFGVPVPGIGFMIFVLLLFLLGVLATNVLGGRLLVVFERWLARLPLLSPIYQGARQITEAIQVRGTTEFRKVVLLTFPGPGMRSVGFVTREFPYPTAFCDEPCSLVFVPTTPNPTTGFLVALPQRELVTLDISVEEGVKLLISGGLLVPHRLLDLGGLTPPGTAVAHQDERPADPPGNH
jgi:uncharacterized membrane protein